MPMFAFRRWILFLGLRRGSRSPEGRFGKRDRIGKVCIETLAMLRLKRFYRGYASLLAATALGAALPVVYKMTTPTPPGIATPDRVDTRLGALQFFDGFP